ncbi:MAG: hypothetical protein PHC50_01450 [Candidatus Cloacimonetes bacterium]|nr:hypothetical protein [Candidatus Cloacimonadota bacterium]
MSVLRRYVGGRQQAQVADRRSSFDNICSFLDRSEIQEDEINRK